MGIPTKVEVVPVIGRNMVDRGEFLAVLERQGNEYICVQ
jgi:hypothetical protein